MGSGIRLPGFRSCSTTYSLWGLGWVTFPQATSPFHVRSREAKSVCLITSWEGWHEVIMQSPKKCVSIGWWPRIVKLLEQAPGRDACVYSYALERLSQTNGQICSASSKSTLWGTHGIYTKHILVIISKLPHSITFSYHKIINLRHLAVSALYTIYIFSHIFSQDYKPGYIHENICSLTFWYCRNIIKESS